MCEAFEISTLNLKSNEVLKPMGTYSIFGVVIHAICLMFSLFWFFFAKEFQMTLTLTNVQRNFK